MTATQSTVRSSYRNFLRFLQQTTASGSGIKSSPAQHEKSLTEVRREFRRPIEENETLEKRLKKANDRLSFLRMTTPKPLTETTRGGGGGVYVEGKDGKLIKAGTTTTRDGSGRVVSNWNGKNLDPDQLKRHKVGLKRAGFVNNLHAKGIF